MTVATFDVQRFQAEETVRREFRVTNPATGEPVTATSIAYEYQRVDTEDWIDGASDVAESPTGVYTFSDVNLEPGLYRDHFEAMASGVNHVVEGRFRVE